MPMPPNKPMLVFKKYFPANEKPLIYVLHTEEELRQLANNRTIRSYLREYFGDCINQAKEDNDWTLYHLSNQQLEKISFNKTTSIGRQQAEDEIERRTQKRQKRKHQQPKDGD